MAIEAFCEAFSFSLTDPPALIPAPPRDFGQ
jgi:hypothetical protein